MKGYNHKLCIAPMMDYTDTHFRYFLRLLSQDIFLYTEMISADALIHGHRNMLLKFDSSEHPIGLQIGGSSIQKMADAAAIGQDYGYDEINLNIGCPSPRVQKGNFGASLMADSQLVSKIISNIKTKIQIPVTVKCRLGIDDQDIEKDLKTFIKSCLDAGADLLIIHARKAWLNGISAKDNRVLPEINYQAVYDIKNYAKETEIIINGEINSYSDIKNHLKYVDGVMLGRKIIIDQLFLRDADTNIFVNKKNKIVLNIKGDGKTYYLRIKSKINDYYSYTIPFTTTSNWQIISLKLADFYPTFRGRKLNMDNFNKTTIEEIGILIGNKKNEEFKIEIKEILIN